jgi:hypothetical protein
VFGCLRDVLRGGDGVVDENPDVPDAHRERGPDRLRDERLHAIAALEP